MRLLPFIGHTNARATIAVFAALLGAFIFTGFISSAYKADRVAIGRSHYDLAQSLVASGQPEDAIEQYRKALIFSPDDTDYRLALATALMKAGRTDEAQTHLEQLIQQNPTSGVLNMMLARVSAKQHKIQQAVDYYQRAVYEYWPPSQLSERRQARWELVALLNSEDKRNEAVAELIQLYAAAPPDPQLRLRVGFDLLNDGATSEAARVFTQVTKQAPQLAAGHKGLAKAEFNSDNYVSARHEVQKAIHLDPNDQESSKLLELINSVIDLDPDVPHISATERLRRSKALLSRAIGNLQTCLGQQPNGNPLQLKLQTAANLFEAKNPNGNLTFDLQDMTQQLWSERAQFCGQNNTPDRVLEAVLTHISNE